MIFRKYLQLNWFKEWKYGFDHIWHYTILYIYIHISEMNPDKKTFLQCKHILFSILFLKSNTTFFSTWGRGKGIKSPIQGCSSIDWLIYVTFLRWEIVAKLTGSAGIEPKHVVVPNNTPANQTRRSSKQYTYKPNTS